MEMFPDLDLQVVIDAVKSNNFSVTEAAECALSIKFQSEKFVLTGVSYLFNQPQVEKNTAPYIAPKTSRKYETEIQQVRHLTARVIYRRQK